MSRKGHIAIAALLSISCGILAHVGSIAYAAWHYDDDSMSLVERALSDILKTEDIDDLVLHSTTNLRDRDKYGRLLSQIARFGKPLSYRPPSGEAVVPLFSKTNMGVTASYQTDVVFERGIMHFQFNLVLLESGWALDYIYVKANALKGSPASVI